MFIHDMYYKLFNLRIYVLNNDNTLHVLQNIYVQFVPYSIQTVKLELLLLIKRLRKFSQYCFR